MDTSEAFNGRAIRLVVPGRRDQLEGDLVPRPVLGELLAEPVAKCLLVDVLALVLPADQDDFPLIGEVLLVVLVGEEVLDKLTSGLTSILRSGSTIKKLL